MTYTATLTFEIIASDDNGAVNKAIILADHLLYQKANSGDKVKVGLEVRGREKVIYGERYLKSA